MHQRQISHLALPPLLIPASQPQASSSTTSSSSSQTQPVTHAATYSTGGRNISNSPIPQRVPTPTPTPPPTNYQQQSAFQSGSLLRPIYQPPQQKGSLISFLQQQHQQQQQSHQQQIRAYTTSSSNKMSSDQQVPEIITRTRAAASGTPGEQVEPRQTLPSEDMEPNPANSIPLPPNRQRLVDDIIALYSCQPSIERVARYAPGELPFRFGIVIVSSLIF